MRSGGVRVRAWAAGREACCRAHHEREGTVMSCKVLVVTGSPRVGGNSDTLAEAFIEGAKSAGCEVRRIDAGRAKIAGCLGCNYCFSHEGACVQQDDMQQFYPDLHWADVLVYATPLYCFTYPAQLKAFQDRMFCGIAKSFNIPRVGLLLCLEDKDITAADSLLDTYKRSNAYTHQESIGEVVVNAVFEKGAIAGNPGLEKARELGASLV